MEHSSPSHSASWRAQSEERREGAGKASSSQAARLLPAARPLSTASRPVTLRASEERGADPKGVGGPGEELGPGEERGPTAWWWSFTAAGGGGETSRLRSLPRSRSSSVNRSSIVCVAGLPGV